MNLPYDSLPCSDGWISPLNDTELIELKAHIESGHTTKSNLCKGCLEAEGPRKSHRTVRDAEKASHVLHIDIAGPLLSSDDGYSYFLVGALRLPGFPLLIDVRLLTSRTSVEVCDQLERMIAYSESLQFVGEVSLQNGFFSFFGVEFSVSVTSKTLLVLSFSSWCMHGSRRCGGPVI